MATQRNNNKEIKMASIRIPSEAEIEQFLYEIDMLEGYSYAEWLDWMEEAYPNVDAPELYASRGENIVTGYRDIRGDFVAGEPPEIDPEIQALIEAQPIGIDRMNAEIGASAKELDEMTQAEKTANYLAMLRDRAENPEVYESIMMEQPEVEQFTQGAIDDMTGDYLSLDSEEMESLGDTPINPLDPMQIGDMITKYSDDLGLPSEAGMLIAAGLTKNPKILKKQDGMISTKNSSILKSKSDKDALADRISTKAKGPDAKTAKTISTKNSTILKEKTPTVSTSNSRVLKEKGPDVSTKNSKVIKTKDSANADIAKTTKAANATKVKNIRDARRNLSNRDKLVAGGITGAATIAALTNNNGLKGNRGKDGSLITADNESFDIPILGEDVVTSPTKTRKASKDKDEGRGLKGYKIPEKQSNTRPGWKQAENGNYWSADFEDEYWNSPAGVQEAIGVWGRPIGNRIGNPIN
jgi:hypothetical protein